MKDVKTEGYFSEIDERPQLAQARFSEKAKKEEVAPKVGAEVSECNAMETTESGSLLDLKDMLRCAKDGQHCEEKNHSDKGMEFWGPAAKAKCQRRPRTEKLKLNKAVDSDGGVYTRPDAAQIGDCEIGGGDHCCGENNGPGAVEIFSGGRPEDVELLFDGDAPELC
jgi:hypothetical protein